MPELPEVETTRRGITQAVVNNPIQQIIIRQAKLRYHVTPDLLQLLPGQSILNITRRSKYLLLHFTHGTLLWHLGMSGHIRIVKPNTPAQKHDHIDIEFENCCLRYTDPRRFGFLLWCDTSPLQHKLLRDLGPEPFSKNFHAAYLHQQAKTRRINVKQFIMQAHVVVGVGNIYASEALFLAGIAPHCPANKISLARYEKLVLAIKHILKKAIKAGGTTLKDFYAFDGKPGYFRQQLNVYARAGDACYRCQTIIKKCVIGQRSSFYCPKCQR